MTKIDEIMVNKTFKNNKTGEIVNVIDAANLIIKKSDVEKTGVNKIAHKETSTSYIVLYASDADAPTGFQEVGVENVQGSSQEAHKEFEKFCNQRRPNWARLISSDGETCFCKYKNKGTFTKITSKNI
jgi:hypothetical protein